MITEPTALILGAGASMPYGFPSGLELMQKILSTIKPHKPLTEDLVGFDIEQNDINYFRECLSRSGKLSADAFLERRPEFLRIGKLVITLLLTMYEIEPNLFDPKMAGNSWYEYLWNKLDAPFDDFDKNKLSIITFNYDRSLEHYLITVMQNLYGKPEEKCAEKLNNIPIIHVHGKLGTLPWQGGLARPYVGSFRNAEEISNQIIVIPEQKGTSPEFKEATKLLFAAKYVYLLGFGYHPKNLERLRIKDVGIETRGTALELGMEERKDLERIWKIRTFGDYNSNLAFLKNHAFFR